MGKHRDNTGNHEQDRSRRPRSWRVSDDDNEIQAFSANELDRMDQEDPPASRFRRHSTRERRPRNERLEEAVRARLRWAGYDVMFRDSEIYIDDEQIGKRLRDQFLKHRDGRNLLTDDDAFGAVVDRFLPAVLKRQAKIHLKAANKKLYLMSARPQPGFKVMQVNTIVAQLTATTFTNAAGEQVVGPFWAPGEHWNAAVSLLLPRTSRPTDTAATSASPSITRAAGSSTTSVPLTTRPQPGSALPHATSSRGRSPATSRVRPAASALRRANWPGDASPALTEIASVASITLRERRIRSDDFPVRIDCGQGRIVGFSPLKRQPRTGVLELPFSVLAPAEELRGSVYLKSPNTPLSISIEHHDATADITAAWALALQVAADRYGGAPGDPDDARSEPAGFTPEGKTREFLTHWVSAHVTRLPEGKRASDDAVKAVEEVDIVLPPHCTWTKGHWRGKRHAVEVEGALRYTWRPTKA